MIRNQKKSGFEAVVGRCLQIHSVLIPAALMIGHHFTVSALEGGDRCGRARRARARGGGAAQEGRDHDRCQKRAMRASASARIPGDAPLCHMPSGELAPGAGENGVAQAHRGFASARPADPRLQATGASRKTCVPSQPGRQVSP
jgi:hypothetical protein